MEDVVWIAVRYWNIGAELIGVGDLIGGRVWIEKALEIGEYCNGYPQIDNVIGSNIDEKVFPQITVTIKKFFSDWMEEFLRAAPREKKLNQVRREEQERRNAEIREEREIKPIESNKKRKYEFGDKGSSWRMMKLQRVFDTAKEEKRSVEAVALDRYGSIEDFQEALEEREYMDKKLPESSRPKRDPYQNAFLKSKFKAPASVEKKETKPITKPIAPVIVQKKPQVVADVLTTDQLNQMYSKVLKARLMKASNADELEEEYYYEKSRAEAVNQEVKVLPTLNSQGQINVYDGKDRKEKEVHPHKQVTHDRQGNRIANLNDNEKTLEDLVREEKMDRSYSYDKDYAHQIRSDKRFDDDLDYVDSTSDMLSRRKEVSVQRQQRNALKDQRRTEKILQECAYCTQNGQPPRITVIAKGIKVYLALPETIDMITYHCLIVPVEHIATTLELDDDAWDEIRVKEI
jgi:hypothetical protein